MPAVARAERVGLGARDSRAGPRAGSRLPTQRLPNRSRARARGRRAERRRGSPHPSVRRGRSHGRVRRAHRARVAPARAHRGGRDPRDRRRALRRVRDRRDRVEAAGAVRTEGSPPTRRSASNARARSSPPSNADFATRSRRARIADHGSASSSPFRTTAPRRPWRPSPSARRAHAPSTETCGIVVSTPKPRRARPADPTRAWCISTPGHSSPNRVRCSTSSKPRSIASRRATSSRSKASAGTSSRATPRARTRSRVSARERSVTRSPLP